MYFALCFFREYLNQHLETRFAKAVAGMVMHEPEKSSIAKPSELVTSVRAYMNVLQTVENHIHIDMTRIFNSVLLQQVNLTKTSSGFGVEFIIVHGFFTLIVQIHITGVLFLKQRRHLVLILL